MRIIEYANAFKRDFKREIKGRYAKLLDSELELIIEQLSNNIKLNGKYINLENSNVKSAVKMK